MNSQELTIHEEKFAKDPMALPEGIDRPEESVSDAAGITVINDIGYDVLVLVSNGFYIGARSSGYIKSGNKLVLPADWAWWDVYVLYENANAHIFTDANIVYFNKKKHYVGYRDIIKISEM